MIALNNPLARPDPSGLDGDCGITCWGEDGSGGGGDGSGGACGLTCAGDGGNGSDPGTAPINLHLRLTVRSEYEAKFRNRRC